MVERLQKWKSPPRQAVAGLRSQGTRRVWALVASLLLVHAGLLAYGAWVHSPTLNEPAHLVAGISHWKFGRFELYRVNPPLVRMVAAIPTLIAGCETNWNKYDTGPGTRAEGPIGVDFIAANGERSLWLFTLARWACIPFSLIGGLFCFLWARELFNHDGAGLIALTLWCFDPNIIAHGQLITADCAATSFGVGAGYLFWRWLKVPTRQRTLAAGLLLGLAELVKTTWIILFVLWPVLWIFWRYASRHEAAPSRRSLKGIAQLATMFGIALYVLNLGYGFDGTFARLKDFTFISSSFTGREESGTPGNRFAHSWVGELPMPVPREYLLGIDAQKHDFEDFHSPSYLRGEWKHGGWWYYYLYALLVKAPHGTQLLLLLLVGALLLCRPPQTDWRDLTVLLAPPLILLTVASLETEINHHFRYVLPAFGFVFVLLGRSVFFMISNQRWLKWSASGLFGWSIVSSLLVYPHSLSYFNEFSGGPTTEPPHLLHSNIDWGQDLLVLKNWLDAHPEARPLYLAYYGWVDPKDIGVEYRSPPPHPAGLNVDANQSARAPDFYAVSVNYLYGDQWHMPDGSGKWIRPGPHQFNELQTLTPIARAGYSILIYRVDP